MRRRNEGDNGLLFFPSPNRLLLIFKDRVNEGKIFVCFAKLQMTLSALFLYLRLYQYNLVPTDRQGQEGRFLLLKTPQGIITLRKNRRTSSQPTLMSFQGSLSASLNFSECPDGAKWFLRSLFLLNIASVATQF